MKKLVIRYSTFLLLFVLLIITSIFYPELGKSSANNIWSNVKEMLGVIPPVFVLLGLLDVWVDRQTMIRYTGLGSGLRGILIAFVLGSAAAGPLYAAFPVAAIMLKKGSSIYNVFVFIGAWSTTKIPMLTFEASGLGIKFMVVRLGLSILGILFIAACIDRILPAEEKNKIYQMNQ
jgi:Predicted permeases